MRYPIDLGAADWEFPDPSEMSAEEAAQVWDTIERQAREANRRAEALKNRKRTAREVTLALVEASPFSSVRVPVMGGREVNLTPYDFDEYSIKNEAAFKEWASGRLAAHYPGIETPAENYYDDTPRLREDILKSEMRRRTQDHEPLPPGVIRYTITKISRTTAARRRH